jgi:hypothetical protein
MWGGFSHLLGQKQQDWWGNRGQSELKGLQMTTIESPVVPCWGRGTQRTSCALAVGMEVALVHSWPGSGVRTASKRTTSHW